MAKYENPLKPAKKAGEPTYNMRRSELDAMCRKATHDGLAAGIYTCNAMYSAAMLTVMHDKLGFGVIRLGRFFDQVQGLFNEIVERRISYLDLAQVLKDECHVNLIIEKNDGVKQAALDLFEDLEKPARIHMEVRK